MRITHYFELDWQGAVVVALENSQATAFFLSQTTQKWIKANPKDILDLFHKASQLTQREFGESFGVIGTDIPELPNLDIE
jgi:hypothetical protein